MKKLVILLLFLTGCGFSPLYSSKSVTYQFLQKIQISVAPIPNQYGAEMRRILKNQIPILTQTPTKKYTLFVTAPTFTGYDKTITNDEFASTIQTTASATYTLQDDKTQKIIKKGSQKAISGYNVESNPYSTTIAKQKVYQELSEQLAEQIGQQVLAFISQDTP